MTDHPHRARRVIARGTLSVALVLALSGALFAANAKFARASGERHPQDLRELAQVETERVTRLSTEVDGLRADVDVLTADENAAAGTVVGTPSEGYLVEGGLVPVTGPGLTVQLDDAPADSPRREDVSADVLVVHQQDLQAVINALWAGGAEGVSLQNQRIITTTGIKCVGNTVRLQGVPYAPPYEIKAVGDAAAMFDALTASPEVQDYRGYTLAPYNLGWTLREDAKLDIPAYSQPISLEYAKALAR